MRLIRDILNEKRAAAARPQTTPVGGAMAPSQESPYVLRSPLPDTDGTDERAFPAEELEHLATGYDAPEQAPTMAEASETEAFFRQASEEMHSSDMQIYEEEAMGEDTAAHDLRDTFEDDDDDDYEDDDPHFDADALEASFDLDDFAPSAVAREAAQALNGTEPFDRLQTQQTPPASSPSPMSTFSATAKPEPSVSAEPEQTATPAPTPTHVEEAAPVAVSEPDEPAPVSTAATPESVDMPAPAAGRGSNRSGRVKTRLLGFSASVIEQNDPFEKKESKSNGMFPVGWLVVVSDMGRGSSYALYDGVSKVGRGEDQTVSLNFGDNSISRENHISIAYDAEQNKFFVGHSGKTNLVRINNMPLLSTQELSSKDLIRLGETTLRFVALCQEDFSWNQPEEKVARHA